MSSYGTPSITFSGLASGLDSKAIIESLMDVRRIPILMLEDKSAGYATRKSNYSTFKTYMETLQTSVESLKDADEFKAFTATPSDDSVLTASATSEASPGAYQLKVFALASSEQEASQNYLNKDVLTVGTGTLSVTVGTTETEISIASGSDTLEGIAAAINASDAEVTASVINDGTDTPYRLTLISKETGEDSAITLDTSGLTGGDQALVFSELKAATDAHYEINGLEMYNSSNTISSSLPGISMTLKDTTSGSDSITLSVERDASAIKDKINDFVSAYNKVIGFIHQQNTFYEGSQGGGVLMGDSMLMRIERSLQSTLVPDWNDAEDAPELQILAQAGVELDNQGQLVTDSLKLDEAIDDHFDDLVAMFSDSGIADEIDTFVEEYTKFNGFIDTKTQSYTDLIKDVGKQIERAESQLDIYESSLITKFASLETLMSNLNAQQAYITYNLLPQS